MASGGRAVLQQDQGQERQVLGWDEKNQKGGTFAQSFTDQNKGRSISQAFVQQEPTSSSRLPVAQVWVRAQRPRPRVARSVSCGLTDGCTSAAQYCKYFLSSVTKNLTDSVTEYATKSAVHLPDRQLHR